MTSEKERLELAQYENKTRMSDSNSDSDEVSTYCTGSSTEISDSEASVVEDNEQNVEPYQFEPAASDAGSTSSSEADTVVAEDDDSEDNERLGNTNW